MSAPRASRRGWLAAAAGFALAGVGAGLAWRTSQRQSQALTEAETAFWLQQFAQLDGAMLASASFKGKPLVLNFWATWCPPCREEMPAFSRLQTKHAANSVQFVGIAIDSAAMVREFSLQYPTTYPLLIGGAEGAELTRQLGNSSRALPYTLIINPTGTATFARLGALAEHELDTLLQKNTSR